MRRFSTPTLPTAFAVAASLSALLILGVFFRNAADIHMRG
jgi:hypothetical protein